jgi:hypothetical protein
MTTLEKINKLKASFAIEQETTKELYLETEAELVKTLGDYIDGAPVVCKTYGNGKVVAVTGNTLEDMIVDIAFVDDTTRRFSLLHIMNNTFIKFEDIYEIGDIWDCAFEAHTNLANAYKACEETAKQLAIEAEKQAEAEKKAEEKYQKMKDKAIKEFEDLTQQAKTSLSTVDEFYYALGWLTNHVGSVSAAIPDYLEFAFEQHFGTDACPRVVDTKKRTSGGFAYQWGIGMTARLRSKDLGIVPAILTQYLNPAGKALTNTSFIWDLIETYGFKFGKKQDINHIRSKVPTKYINSFNDGLTA